MKSILFTATWCSPCKNLKEYASKHDINFSEVYDIDSDAGQEMSAKHGIRGVPTSILLDGSKEVDRMVGFDMNKIANFKVGE